MKVLKMNPVIIESKSGQYLYCPNDVCGRVLNLNWDNDNHKVVYPKRCELCGQEIEWNIKLTDLKPFKKEDNLCYMTTGYFHRFKKRKKK